VQTKKPSEHPIEPAGLVQAKIVNSKAMDDIFVAFRMVQQITTGLSGAASVEENI
jgi:hypothetical protein